MKTKPLNNSKFNKSKFRLSSTLLFFLILFFLVSGIKVGMVWAEQSGSTPDSGTDSRIKAIYDLLKTTYDQGSDSSGSWGDWGAYWNRIRSNLVDYSQQSLVEYDDYESGDSETEEGTWTQTNSSPEVWKDQLTGLYWSANQGSNTNVFPDQDHSTCDFFSASDRGTYDGTDGDCGNAINACGTLSLDDGGGSETDWYLPTQKELQQAYINGMYNQAGATFTTTSYFWSSTERSNYPAYSWYVYLDFGYTYGNTKVTSYPVRCVRRD